jgi:integrase
MTDARRTRQSNGRSSIYKGSDGRWHGRVTVGVRDDGRPDRRHVRAGTKAEVTQKVRRLEELRTKDRVPVVGADWTVERWLAHWLEHVAASHVKLSTLAGYGVAVNHHLIPGVGKHHLDKLQPEHLERLYRRIQERPTKTGGPTRPATAHQVHRTMRTALNEAVRRGYLARNPASLARAPRVEPHEIEPFSIEEIRRLFLAASRTRNGPRWVIALALGLRQGEALGLQWPDVDLERSVLTIRRSRVRPKYTHGCGGGCGKDKAGYCPQRIQINAETDTTKSRAGRRQIGLPPHLAGLLEQHRLNQDRERRHARDAWVEGVWVFSTEIGAPISPRTDWSHWKQLLKDADIRDSRLHDARHTAATVLLLLGVSQPTMMNIMGWSNPAMAQRYAHVVDPIRRDVADRVGGLLWEQAESPPDPK